MRMFRFAFFVCPLLALIGCSYPETVDSRVQFQEKDSVALITTEYINLSSDETDPSKLKEDFDDLLHSWKDDAFIVDAADSGLYVKKRDVFLRDEQLVGRVEGMMSKKKVDESYEFFTGGGERILLLDSHDKPEVLETNGKILKTDKNILIIWPDDAKEHWKVRSSALPGPFSKNKEFMVKAFKDYQAGRWTPSKKR